MGAIAGARPHVRTWGAVEPGFAMLFGAACLVLLADELVAWSGAWSFAALALGILYAMLGVGVFPRVERARSLGTTLAYFAVQLPLGVAAFLLSHAGGTFLLVLAVGQAIRVLPLGWVLAASAPLPFLHAGMEDRGEAVQNAAVFLAAIVLTVGFSRAVERERRARAELDEANQRLRAYAAQAEELATTRERNRLARELHDTLAQGFMGVLLQLEAVDSALSTSRADLALDRLERARALARDSLAEARRSVWSLRPRALERQGLPEAVRDAVRALVAGDSPTVRFETGGEPRPLEPELEADLLRVAQEAVTNARKHAQACNVTLELRYDPEEVELRVRDDGLGFLPDQKAGRVDGGGFGLTAMRERLERHGGGLDVRSAPGMGTEVVARAAAPNGDRGSGG